MSRFYASIQGNRGEATRQGTPNSGIRGHVRGWNVGIAVHGEATTSGGDQFDVYLTSGSNRTNHDRYLMTITDSDHGPQILRVSEELEEWVKGNLD